MGCPAGVICWGVLAPVPDPVLVTPRSCGCHLSLGMPRRFTWKVTFPLRGSPDTWLSGGADPGARLFWLQGRGTVVTGRVEQGIVRTGDEVEILGIQAPTKTTVTGESQRVSKPSAAVCTAAWIMPSVIVVPARWLQSARCNTRRACSTACGSLRMCKDLLARVHVQRPACRLQCTAWAASPCGAPLLRVPAPAPQAWRCSRSS